MIRFTGAGSEQLDDLYFYAKTVEQLETIVAGIKLGKPVCRNCLSFVDKLHDIPARWWGYGRKVCFDCLVNLAVKRRERMYIRCSVCEVIVHAETTTDHGVNVLRLTRGDAKHRRLCRACADALRCAIEFMDNNPKEAHRVWAQNSRTQKAGLESTLTICEWKAILESNKWRCHHCKKAPVECMDHLVPVSAGGGTTSENVVPSCNRCNLARATKKGNGWGHIELKTINGSGTYRYLRYWSNGKLKSKYIGKNL